MSRKISVASSRNSDSTNYALYTVPVKNTALWNMLYMISTAGNTSPEVYWYDSSTNTTYPIVAGKNLGTGEYILFNDAEVALQENDIIYVKNPSATNVTFIATLELVPNQATQFHGG